MLIDGSGKIDAPSPASGLGSVRAGLYDIKAGADQAYPAFFIKQRLLSSSDRPTV
ncbi:MAG: hypothetical protein ACTSSQ_07030 [Alphaproteobacteria bacterium]